MINSPISIKGSLKMVNAPGMSEMPQQQESNAFLDCLYDYNFEGAKNRIIELDQESLSIDEEFTTDDLLDFLIHVWCDESIPEEQLPEFFSSFYQAFVDADQADFFDYIEVESQDIQDGYFMEMYDYLPPGIQGIFVDLFDPVD